MLLSTIPTTTNGVCVGTQHDEWSAVGSTSRPASTNQKEAGQMLPGGSYESASQDEEMCELHADAMQCSKGNDMSSTKIMINNMLYFFNNDSMDYLKVLKRNDFVISASL